VNMAGDFRSFIEALKPRLYRFYFSTDHAMLARIEDYRWGKARWHNSEDKSRNAAILELIQLGLEAVKTRQ